MDTNIPISSKNFCVELKKEIHCILEKDNSPWFENFTIVYHITNSKIEFSLMYSFPIDEYMPLITKSIQKLYHIFGLEKDYSPNFLFRYRC